MNIYVIRNLKSGSVYVGQTKQNLKHYFHRQGFRALSGSKSKPKLYDAIRRYGIDNFEIEALAECYSVEAMNILEVAFIQLFRAQEHGYNVADGGGGRPGVAPWNKGKKLGVEFKEAVSKGQLKRFSEQGSPNTGRQWTAEMRLNMSIKMKSKGIRPSKEACAKGGRVSQGGQ